MADSLVLPILGTNTNVFSNYLWLTHFTWIAAYIVAIFVNFIASFLMYFPPSLFLGCYFVSFIFVLFPFLALFSRCVKETDEVILYQFYFICSHLSEIARDYEGVLYLFSKAAGCTSYVIHCVRDVVQKDDSEFSRDALVLQIV
jgi:hypothetical protein